MIEVCQEGANKIHRFIDIAGILQFNFKKYTMVGLETRHSRPTGWKNMDA